MLQLPRLYPILDAACFSDADDDGGRLVAAAEELAAAGCTLLQYRNKSGNARQMLDEARELRARLGAIFRPNVKLIMNDRADLCLAAGFDGLHVGQDDLSARIGEAHHWPRSLAGSINSQSGAVSRSR